MKTFLKEYGVFDFFTHLFDIIVSLLFTIKYLINYNDPMFTLWLFILIFWICVFIYKIKDTINIIRNTRKMS